MTPHPTPPTHPTAHGLTAQVGDWLVVTPQHGLPRRGQITVIHGACGAPPYSVRWTDTDHEAFVYPGPDALVLTPGELEARNADAAEHSWGGQGVAAVRPTD